MSKDVDLLTVVMRLPEDSEQRRKVGESLKLGGSFHGAEITAMGYGDEMTLCEKLEDHLDLDLVEELREEVQRSHERAVKKQKDSNETL